MVSSSIKGKQMADALLLKKLLIKAGQTMAVINAPPGYMARLIPLPEGVQMVNKSEAPLDFIQIFVKNIKDVDGLMPGIVKVLKPDGLLWVCYPKGGAKARTDLNRDILWKAMEKFGEAGVSLISIDDVWSAMRFRPAAKVGK